MIHINARQAALTVLERCRREGAWSGQALDETIKKASLDKRDAALASRLCLGVLQNGSLCDFYIDSYSSVKAKKLEPKVRDILCMGVYQLVFMNIPPRAAVSESVRLCKETGYERAAGLVNAVLRRVAENAAALPEVPGKGSVEHLSVKYSHSQWMVKRLVEENGYEHTEAFLSCNNSPSPLSIQVNTLRCSVADYCRLLDIKDISYRRHAFLEGCLLLEGGMVSALPGYEDGLFYVQDPAARASVEIAAPESGMSVLDACAAPGGKSFAAAIRMGNKGSVLSRDIHEKKLRLVREGAARLGIDIISTAAADARKPEPSCEGAFDLVIADVPCSGLGVIGKKPEIRFKKEQDISGLPGIQYAVLDSLASCVRPGGTLLYSTCTVLRAENEHVALRFLSAHPEFVPVPFELGNIRAENGMHCFWPNRDDTDGFFAAKFMRK